jgi:hypothetical protein
MTKNPGRSRPAAQVHVYGFRSPKYRQRPWLYLRVVVATTSLGDARRILGREGFDRPKHHFRVDDEEAESLALANPGTLVWQSLDDWGTDAQSWQIGGAHTIEELTQRNPQLRSESDVSDQS